MLFDRRAVDSILIAVVVTKWVQNWIWCWFVVLQCRRNYNHHRRIWNAKAKILEFAMISRDWTWWFSSRIHSEFTTLTTRLKTAITFQSTKRIWNRLWTRSNINTNNATSNWRSSSNKEAITPVVTIGDHEPFDQVIKKIGEIEFGTVNVDEGVCKFRSAFSSMLYRFNDTLKSSPIYKRYTQSVVLGKMFKYLAWFDLL